MTKAVERRWRTLCVWRGLGLRNWLRLLRLRPSIDASGLPLAASLCVTSPINSALGAVESLFWNRRVRQVELHESPIFILGHWRSGTTLLHNLLAMDPQFASINLYQSLFPSHFLLTERIVTRLARNAVPATRPMDLMPAGWQLPQEDETSMMLLTLHSPYLYPAFPDNPDVYRRYGDLRRGLTERELERWQDTFLHLLRKVALQQGRSRFILKSPTHTVRIPILKGLFPKAQYLHIVRNPYEVYASTVRLRRSMAQMNGLSQRPFAALEDEVLDGYLMMYNAYHMHRALLDPSHICEVRYEDLVADPVRSIEGIYQAYGLGGFDEQRQRIEAILPELQRHRTLTDPLPADERERVAARWAPAFRRYGYSLDADASQD